jgi:hypothetical protein
VPDKIERGYLTSNRVGQTRNAHIHTKEGQCWSDLGVDIGDMVASASVARNKLPWVR